MKYAPKKVFILENGLYKEITYSELKQLKQADKSYMDKFFCLCTECLRQGTRTG